MILQKTVLLSVVSLTLLNAMDTPPMMPPMVPPVHKSKKEISKKEVSTIDSCKMIPPMILHLPPPMESSLIKCKNEENIPSKKLLEKQLSTLLKRKVKVLKVEIVKKFNQLYKVTYNGGVILTNKNANAFIRQ